VRGRYGPWGIRVKGRGGSNGEGFGLDGARAEKALPVALRAARCHGCEVGGKRSAAYGSRSVAVHALLIAGLSSFAWCERSVVMNFWRGLWRVDAAVLHHNATPKTLGSNANHSCPFPLHSLFFNLKKSASTAYVRGVRILYSCLAQMYLFHVI
jgi:hypothetical protein